jgi:hypothetical protein
VSRKSRREIEQAIEQLDTEEDDMNITEVESEVTIVTPENIDEEPEVAVPNDATILPTESDVVTWYKRSIETPEESV